MEPVCQPMASRWQMPFASSRGYGSLKLQHDVAKLLCDRYARTRQTAVISRLGLPEDNLLSLHS